MRDELSAAQAESLPDFSVFSNLFKEITFSSVGFLYERISLKSILHKNIF